MVRSLCSASSSVELTHERQAGLQDGGVYFIVNEKTGTTIDVSGGDGRSVSGWTKGEGENQKVGFSCPLSSLPLRLTSS
jgi:hypothetical protein